MPDRNEFLRKDPKSKSRKLIYDLTNLIIPFCILMLGLVHFTQKFAELVNYNQRYCGNPVFVFHHNIGKYPAGYPVFNPLTILITMFTNPFDEKVSGAIGDSSLPGIICAVISVFTFIAVSMDITRMTDFMALQDGALRRI